VLDPVTTLVPGGGSTVPVDPGQTVDDVVNGVVNPVSGALQPVLDTTTNVVNSTTSLVAATTDAVTLAVDGVTGPLLSPSNGDNGGLLKTAGSLL
jgi:hypothetical protein